MYQVCDSRMTCLTINGPNIRTTASEPSDAEFMNIIESIKASMNRFEYNSAFSTALPVAISFKVFKLVNSVYIIQFNL